jgi:DNA repair protein RadD
VITLRPYQIINVERMREAFRRGIRRVCYALPTGGGKTVEFIEILRRAQQRGTRVAVLVHRQELIDQTAEALRDTGIGFGYVAAGYPETPGAQVLLCMVPTLVRRRGRLAGIGLIIIDECHQVMAASYLAILKDAPDAFVLGVSATPERLDGKGLAACFDELIVGPTVRELIDAGYLSSFKLCALERRIDLSILRTVMGDYDVAGMTTLMVTPEMLAAAVDEYRKHCDGQRMLIFTASVIASRRTAKHFQAAGYRSAHLDGDTPKQERREILAKLATGAVQIVSNCGLVSECLNIPAVAAVMQLRPIKSTTIYLQQIGRALRPAADKSSAIILDIAGNCYRHGMPDLDRAWSLEGRERKKGEAPVKRCPSCGAIVHAAVMICPECGHVFEPPPLKPVKPTPLIEPPPAVVNNVWLAGASWKRALGLDRDKENARALALRLYPTAAELLRRKSDHHRAEALLLAHWRITQHGESRTVA